MKKRLPILAIICLLAATSHSQIRKGMIFLGADLNGSIYSKKVEGMVTEKNHSFGIIPTFGKVIKDNILFGGRIGVQGSKTESQNSSYEFKNTTFHVGVFLRKYKSLGNSGFFLFGQAGLNLLRGKHENSNNSNYGDNAKSFLVSLSAYPGIAYAATKRLHLETGLNNLVMLNYESLNRTLTNAGISHNEKSQGVSFMSSMNNGGGNSLYLGMRWFL